MTCSLCQQNKPLHQSHIIPEFFYTTLYDEKHRFNLLSSKPETPNRIEQKGFRERLLCGDCEGLLSLYERYGSQVLLGGAPGIMYTQDRNIVALSGIDYRLFKLFLLSIVWRASASKLDLFRHVDLGPHAERIRLMILNNEPGQLHDYPSILFGLTMEPGTPPGLMIPPQNFRVAGQRAYRFVFPGLLVVFFVSSSPMPKQYLDHTLQRDGSIIIQIRSVMDLPTLHAFMSAFDKLGRKPRLDV